MIELRKSPRINVTWRGLMKMGGSQIVPIRVINVSESGVLILSAQALPLNAEFQMMLEVPNIDHMRQAPHKVPCKVVVLHSVLSGDYFRVGVRFIELTELHKDLLNAWVSLANKQENHRR
ncbi:PilZ domain-containing protein [Undibacterium fentianense]|uniref:PilZ domain-containing protein n=1 Tax=Undibacterium fentianense TaxID=2828728 RepID=A0A941E1S0_9BURK|nr:PilZ domain-containing protein [Undibacterium fentianense]MBR7799064.1 PilZ domain-containing protein [Undibacterium fentianense]